MKIGKAIFVRASKLAVMKWFVMAKDALECEARVRW